MSTKGANQQNSRLDAVAAAKESQRLREKTYREQAMKLFPPVCGRCGRDFSGKKLRELTVHHRDHNHDYNPPDGSNWELLCIYCHENEHSRYHEESAYGGNSTGESDARTSFGNNPFAGLEALLKLKK